MNLDKTFCMAEKEKCANTGICDRHFDRYVEYVDANKSFKRMISAGDFSKDLKTPKSKCDFFSKMEPKK